MPDAVAAPRNSALQPRSAFRARRVLGLGTGLTADIIRRVLLRGAERDAATSTTHFHLVSSRPAASSSITRTFTAAMSWKKDDELGVAPVAFWQDKASVLQEARVFNESPISPRRCRILLTKILYLLYTGESFTRQEATTLFFGATKLFQHKDPALRQMVYLAIKELSPLAEDVIMVTASIMKDMQPNTAVIYRPNAIRALARVIDPSMAHSVERYFKTALVDRNSSIASAAVVSAYHLIPAARDVVRRWANEVQEAIHPKAPPPSSMYGSTPNRSGSSASRFLGFAASAAGYTINSGRDSSSSEDQQYVASTSFIIQYHVLGLLYLIRQGDRIAVTKLVQQYSGVQAPVVLRNPMAVCQLVRLAAKIADDDPDRRRQMLDLLEAWLRHTSDMVNYEAAKAICELRGVNEVELTKPVSVLRVFLGSPRGPLKFAAIRTLSKLAQTHPQAVKACNVEMENLITDPNRSVATFAITTLLKTGNEASVDRLMKQISSFMTEISDEFKIVVLDAIRSLCLKFPSKQSVMLHFLYSVLRDEGGYEFKRTVVDAIIDMIRFVGDCKEVALAHLCEFIEDCEFTKLSVRILHLLGQEGPFMPEPAKFIRYIYNRVILENAIVRAAAVNSLAKFGLHVPKLRNRIAVLLERCTDDVDDEVRDRAVIQLALLRQPPLGAKVLGNDSKSTFRIAALEDQLAGYLADPAAQFKPFDASTVPRITHEEATQAALRAKNDAIASVAMGSDATGAAGIRAGGPSTSAAGAAAMGVAPSTEALPPAEVGESAYAVQLAAVPALAELGPVLHSSRQPVLLTESETEYTVAAVKHVFPSHIVVQYNVTNTLSDTVLEDVHVAVQGTFAEAGAELESIIPAPHALNAAEPTAATYVIFRRTGFPLFSLENTLKFNSKEVDPVSGEPEEEGYADEYQTLALEVDAEDYIDPAYADFASEWSGLTGAEVKETFALTAMQTLQEACDQLVELYGMQPLEGTETVGGASVHTLLLAGMVVGAADGKPAKVLARFRMTLDGSEGVMLELSAHSTAEAAVQLVASVFA